MSKYIEIEAAIDAVYDAVELHPIEDDVIDEEAEMQGELKKYVALDDVLKLREIFPYDEKGDTHFTLGIASACEYAEHLPTIEVMEYQWLEGV